MKSLALVLATLTFLTPSVSYAAEERGLFGSIGCFFSSIFSDGCDTTEAVSVVSTQTNTQTEQPVTNTYIPEYNPPAQQDPEPQEERTIIKYITETLTPPPSVSVSGSGASYVYVDEQINLLKQELLERINNTTTRSSSNGDSGISRDTLRKSIDAALDGTATDTDIDNLREEIMETIAALPTSTGGESFWTEEGSDIYFDGGNVGIGTDDPQHLLDLGSSYINSDGSAYFAQSVLVGVGEERLGYALDVTGNSYFSILDSENAFVIYNNSNEYTVLRHDGEDNQNLLLMEDGGFVGIGNSSPTAALDVFADGVPALKVTQADSGYSALTVTAGTAAFDVGYTLNFSQEDQSRLFIDVDGNVGMGTTTPQYKLSVAGDGYFSGQIFVSTTTTPQSVASKSYVDTAVNTSLGFADSTRAPIMSNPPVVTLSQDYSSSPSIPGGSLVPMTSSVFRYGGADMAQGESYPYDAYYYAQGLTSPLGQLSFTVEFNYDGTEFEFSKMGGGYYRLIVDGQRVTNEFQASGTSDGSLRYQKVVFDSAKMRNIKIELAYANFGGIVKEASATVYPPHTKQGKRAIFIGDSFTEPFDGYVNTTSRLLGWEGWNSGSGGTGYVNQGPYGRVNFTERVQSDVIDRDPDVVVIAGGINDGNASELQNNAEYVFKEIRDNLPNTKLIVVGPWWPNGNPNEEILEGRDMIKAAALKYNAVFIDPIEEGWITGHYGDCSTGNACRYTSTDGTHPTQAGHDYLGVRLASRILELAPDAASVSPTTSADKLSLSGGTFTGKLSFATASGTAAYIGNKFVINNPYTEDTNAEVLFTTGTSTNKGLVVQGTNSQIANLQEWQNSSGLALMSVASDGSLRVGTTTSNTLLSIAGTSYIHGLASFGANLAAAGNITTAGGISLTTPSSAISIAGIYGGSSVVSGDGSTMFSAAGIPLSLRYNGAGAISAEVFKVDTQTDYSNYLTSWYVNGNRAAYILNSGSHTSPLEFGTQGGMGFMGGNIGVGTTTASQRLTVAGNARFTSVTSGTYAFDLNLTSDGTLTTSASDRRLKDNIESLNASSTLDKILQLQPSSFTWKADGTADIGLIAQDVATVFPELTFTNPTDQYMGVNYSRLSTLLISAVQELYRKVESFSTLFVTEKVETNEVETKKLCIDGLCITRDELETILIDKTSGSGAVESSNDTSQNSGGTEEVVDGMQDGTEENSDVVDVIADEETSEEVVPETPSEPEPAAEPPAPTE